MKDSVKVRKTVREILLELPLQKRLQFKEEIRRVGNYKLQETLSITFLEDLNSVLSGLLTWNKTKQGVDYWAEICFNSNKK